MGAAFASTVAVPTKKDPRGEDAIRALIDQVDAICAESAEISREIDTRMKRRPLFMPERRTQKHWNEIPIRSAATHRGDDE